MAKKKAPAGTKRAKGIAKGASAIRARNNTIKAIAKGQKRGAKQGGAES